MPSRRLRRHRAFALLEVVVALVVVVALLAVFSLAAVDSRRNASLSTSLSNLKQFASGGSAYAADNNDAFWTFTWRAGHTPSAYPDLQTAASDYEAAANQAVDIIRRRVDPAFPRINAWVPHIFYSTLVLADHLNLPLPLPWVVSPEDTPKVAWQQYPNNPVPLPQGGPETRRWVFSSSYELGPAFWSRDQRVGSNFTVQQGSDHTTFFFQSPLLPLGDRRTSQVTYPSLKAMVYDTHQRHFGNRMPFFAMTEARVPVLTVDGSAEVRATSEANQGFLPNNPTAGLPTSFTYSPLVYEPAVPPGSQSLVFGRYRWTRGGLTGRDLGAPEVCTGQPGCTP